MKGWGIRDAREISQKHRQRVIAAVVKFREIVKIFNFENRSGEKHAEMRFPAAFFMAQAKYMNLTRINGFFTVREEAME